MVYFYKGKTGRKQSKETIEKRVNNSKGQTRSNKGKPSWNSGRTGIYTKETKQKMSKSKINTHRVYDNPEHTKWHMEKK